MYNINNEGQKQWDSSYLTPTIQKPHEVLIPTVFHIYLTREWSAAETDCLHWQEHLNAVNLDQIPDFWPTTVRPDDLYPKFLEKIHQMHLPKKSEMYRSHGTYMQNFLSCIWDNLLFLTGTA